MPSCLASELGCGGGAVGWCEGGGLGWWGGVRMVLGVWLGVWLNVWLNVRSGAWLVVYGQ